MSNEHSHRAAIIYKTSIDEQFVINDCGLMFESPTKIVEWIELLLSRLPKAWNHQNL